MKIKISRRRKYFEDKNKNEKAEEMSIPRGILVQFNASLDRKRFHILWLYSSPMGGGYSSSHSTTSSSRRFTTWHSRSPRRAEFTINGKISSSRNTSNWCLAPSFDSSCNSPPEKNSTFPQDSNKKKTHVNCDSGQY